MTRNLLLAFFARLPTPVPVVISGVLPAADAVICADCSPTILYNRTQHKVCPVCGGTESVFAARVTDPGVAPSWPWWQGVA